jgi:hypothetical protein
MTVGVKASFCSDRYRAGQKSRIRLIWAIGFVLATSLATTGLIEWKPLEDHTGLGLIGGVVKINGFGISVVEDEEKPPIPITMVDQRQYVQITGSQGVQVAGHGSQQTQTISPPRSFDRPTRARERGAKDHGRTAPREVAAGQHANWAAQGLPKGGRPRGEREIRKVARPRHRDCLGRKISELFVRG